MPKKLTGRSIAVMNKPKLVRILSFEQKYFLKIRTIKILKLLKIVEKIGIIRM